MAADRTDEPAPIRITGLTKDYTERVLDNVDLELMPGDVHALLGANGAGKSTFCNILAGLLDPSAGEIRIGDQLHDPADKRQAESAGIQIVQQHLNLFPELSVAENLLLTRLPNRLGWINRSTMLDQSREALAKVGLEDLDPQSRLGEHGVGIRQLVEIAAALIGNCRLLILDEPTAALTDAETRVLFLQVRELAARGVAVLYVSHRLDEVRELCNRWTVLRDGKRAGSGNMDEVNNAQLVQLLAGESSSDKGSYHSCCTDEELLRVDNLSGSAVHNVSLTLHRGERLGIAGLVGSGRSELLRLIFGAARASSGSLSVRGRIQSPFNSPREAIIQGLGMVTEDRKTDGLLLSKSILMNTSLAAIPHSHGVIRPEVERERVRVSCAQLHTRYRHAEQPVEQLSGGNQQKVLLARWLETDAEIYLLDEPTRGIDIQARQQIHQLFEELVEQGKGLIIVSSDIDELTEVCDRVLTISHGFITGTFTRDAWTRQELIAATFTEPEVQQA